MDQQPSQSQQHQAPLAIIRYDLNQMAQILGDMGVTIPSGTITIKDLNKPTSENVLMIHKSFLELCLSVKRVNHDMEPPELLNSMDQEDAKAHLETFKLLQLYKLTCYFQDMCCLQNSFMEIFNPTKKAFQKQITYALNFCKFEFRELVPIGDIQRINKEYLDDCRKIKEEDEDLLRKIHVLKIARKENRERVEKAKLDRDNAKKNLEEMQIEQKRLQEQDAKINKETEMVLGEKAEALAKLEAIQKKMCLYEKLLVKSPTRLKNSIEKTEARIAELEKLIRSKTEELKEQKKNLFDREKFIENFRTCTDLLNMFYENDVLSANAKIKEIEKTREEINNHICLQKQLKSDIAELESENQKLQNEFKAKEKSFTRKTGELQAKINESQRNIKEKEKQIESVKVKIAEIIEQKETQVAKFRQTRERSMEIIEQCYKNINMNNIVLAGKEAFINSLIDKTNTERENFIKSQLEHNKFLENLQKEMDY